ncbi:angiotensin-converting enzyme-like [Saccostrea echinata]|uniref:angiotensin-converting enzyme-like n=1 Tax=Saccostrea echinata TaxID=191078 RepID=UPI002A8220CF|nr:angiotensin-converting enzyme-like [Saccostrea echinata]
MRVIWCFLVICILCTNVHSRPRQQQRLRQLLQQRRQEINVKVSDWLILKNEEYRRWLGKVAFASWNYETDLSKENGRKLNEVNIRFASWQKKCVEEASQKLKIPGLADDTRHQLRILSYDVNPSDPTKLRKMNSIQTKLEEIYGKGTVVFNGTTIQLEPGITNIFDSSRDPAVLSDLWVKWRDATGKKMANLYTEWVELQNTGALEHGFENLGDAWRQKEFFDTPELVEIVEGLWQEIKPLYVQLHSYVRRKLKNYYAQHHPTYDFPNDGSIPAHLLGNMWAQEWDNIFNIVQPYPEVKEPDFDKIMVEKGYNVGNMFRIAEEFYTSIGLYKMVPDFWKRSMLVRPKEKDREVQCHASAFDFYNNDTFRIKMCTEVKMNYFQTIHHEMGHIEYFMAYRNQPAVYRTGANGGFHEAIGDTIALSVRTRKHLQTLGLLEENSVSDEDKMKSDINYLMRQALLKLAFLPFGYLVDKWRWRVFSGEVTPDKYNEEWWKMRLEYQGVTSPVPRTITDFDPGAKFHVAANAQYIVYFTSFILQFQFYEAMCNASGHQGPLYTCDFYRSKEAGLKLLNMLKLGGSKHWKEALQQMTGKSKIDTEPFKKYFQPLTDFLKKENKGEVGWAKANINWKQETNK